MRQSSSPGFPYLLLSTRVPFPNKISCFISTCVSSDSSFLSVRQEPALGPCRGPPLSYNIMTRWSVPRSVVFIRHIKITSGPFKNFIENCTPSPYSKMLVYTPSLTTSIPHDFHRLLRAINLKFNIVSGREKKSSSFLLGFSGESKN